IRPQSDFRLTPRTKEAPTRTGQPLYLDCVPTATRRPTSRTTSRLRRPLSHATRYRSTRAPLASIDATCSLTSCLAATPLILAFRRYRHATQRRRRFRYPQGCQGPRQACCTMGARPGRRHGTATSCRGRNWQPGHWYRSSGIPHARIL
ncbi:hypothetical protein BN1723_017864, partial [Verticillium longisporum]